MSDTSTFRRAARLLSALALLLLASCASTSARAANTGEQKTAVLLVNFEDRAVQPITPAAAQTLVFGSVSDFYWENSYQKTFLSGQTFGWFTIPVSSATCDVQLIAREADKAATAAGVNLADYERLVYLAPHNACTVAGYNNGPGISPSRTWIITDHFDIRLIAHELGHNFGLSHSTALDCGTASLGGTCTSYSYGDLADTMGSGDAPHFNAFQKEALGWLGTSGQPPIITAAASGRYTIAPLETTGGGAKAIRIARGIDAASGQVNYYYVEYRQPIGFDTTLAAVGNLATGVLVHTGGPSLADGVQQQSILLDMMPASYAAASDDFVDSALAVGRSYTDAAAKVTITLVAADANGAIVDVTVGNTQAASCMRGTPTLSLTGPAAAVAPGATQGYSLALTNRDSSACDATSFNLARSVPSGWVGTLAATMLTLSPGATGATTLSVSSPTSATGGSYGIGIGASSSVGTVHTASASATYAVAPSTATLTESIATDKANYVRGETVRMSALVKANGVAAANANVRFTVTLPSGATTTLSAVSGNDGSARASYRTAKGKSASGDYRVRADASKGVDSATATTDFSVL
jgi:hypothetical protein